MEKIKQEKIVGCILKTIAIVASVYGIVINYDSIKTFTFFTTLSNIAISMTLFVSLIFDIIWLRTRGKKDLKNNFFYIIKFVMTISITVTFLVYMFLLAPFNQHGFFGSYFNNYAGSFCVHFLGPVLSIIDFFMFDYNYVSNKYHAIYATIPPLLYVAMISCMAYSGVRWYGTMYAPYSFLNFGSKAGWFGFDSTADGVESLCIGVGYILIFLVIFFIGLGEFYLYIKDKRCKSHIS